MTVKDTGFSIDELIVRMQDLFQQRAFPELLKEIPMLFDEVLRLLVVKRSPLPVLYECGCTDHVLDGTKSRTIKTPIREMEFAESEVPLPMPRKRFACT